jgi:CheY-like chemotaxis protein
MEASGGSEGLRMARERKPDLIVLDLGMNDVNGFDVLEALNREPNTSGIPVVIYTSKNLEEHEYSRLSTAVDVIPKSIMGSREVAAARFSEAFKKAGLAHVTRHIGQPVAAE